MEASPRPSLRLDFGWLLKSQHHHEASAGASSTRGLVQYHPATRQCGYCFSAWFRHYSSFHTLWGIPPPAREEGCSYLIAGGVVKLWNGGGEGRVHSSPGVPTCAPSHGLSEAFSPPLTVLMMIYRNSRCEAPKEKAPIEEIMLNSAKIGL